jgi:hypothetical protein
MDPLTASAAGVALVLGTAIGWLVARSRSRRTIADLNAKLVLERRLNKQLGEMSHVGAVRSFIKAPDFTTDLTMDLAASVEPTREPTVAAG